MLYGFSNRKVHDIRIPRIFTSPEFIESDLCFPIRSLIPGKLCLTNGLLAVAGRVAGRACNPLVPTVGIGPVVDLKSCRVSYDRVVKDYPAGYC